MLGGGGGRVCFWSRPISVGWGRGSKRSAPLFPGPQGEPAHGLHPRFVVAEIWADRGVGFGLGGPCRPFPSHGWSAPGGRPLLLHKQPIWAAGDTPAG